MSAATQPPMCFSAQAPLWTRSAPAAETHRNECCHTTADVPFSARAAVDSVGLGRPTHRNERCDATADVLFNAGTAVGSVDLGRPDTHRNERCHTNADVLFSAGTAVDSACKTRIYNRKWHSPASHSGSNCGTTQRRTYQTTYLHDHALACLLDRPSPL